MSTYHNIAEAAAAVHEIGAQLKAHIEQSRHEESRLRAALLVAEQAVKIGAAGLDLEKIALAESVIYVRGEYARAGEDRASVVRDAIAEISTGNRLVGTNLWDEAFGTKDFAHWHGQRSDHRYGYGPKHGWIIFQIGLRDDVRKRDPKALTEEERIACVYLLTNLERVQANRAGGPKQ